jgi:hypothetical protein
MPLAWDARLELVGRGVPAEFRVLADYEKVSTDYAGIPEKGSKQL